ncbi:hypothetical protein Q1695_002509 [Nippostrongylus brasiliensis]|nr:hypothetical protein Q1695_002509 [Nippostrongylus brasiliensis]
MSSGNVFSRGLSRISRRKKRRRNLSSTPEQGGNATSSIVTNDAEYLTQTAKPSRRANKHDNLSAIDYVSDSKPQIQLVTGQISVIRAVPTH